MELATFTRAYYMVVILLLALGYINGHVEHAKLLLVSFDGFRWDYLDKAKERGYATPNFDSLITNGVKAKYGVKNAFVTKTLPNHYSIVTGMYEENHGVVGNRMYDPSFQEYFDVKKDAADGRWWNNGTSGEGVDHGWKGPEPIWVTNQKDLTAGTTAALKKRTGVMFWPGSEASVQGVRPTYFKVPYDSTFPNRSRIDQIVKWFTMKNEPINLGLMYFSEPDHLGHNVGPDSAQMMEMIVALDGIVGDLISNLTAEHLFHHINLIITSDHGMITTSDEKVVDLAKFVNLSLAEVITGGSPVIHILPKKGHEKELLDQLKTVKNLNIFTKPDIPPEYHYTYNRRILDIVVAADIGYNIITTPTVWTNRGGHGYNNSVSEMRPFFIAHGPAFKRGYVSEHIFNNVDIYPLMCEILDLEPGPNDGHLGNIAHILEDDEEQFSLLTMITFLLSVAFAATVAGLFSIAACRSYRIIKHRRRHLVLPLNMLNGQTRVLLGNTTDEEEIP